MGNTDAPESYPVGRRGRNVSRFSKVDAISCRSAQKSKEIEKWEEEEEEEEAANNSNRSRRRHHLGLLDFDETVFGLVPSKAARVSLGIISHSSAATKAGKEKDFFFCFFLFFTSIGLVVIL